jgi:hypothetical protein
MENHEETGGTPSDFEPDNEMEQLAYGEDEAESPIVEYLVGSPDIRNIGYLHDIQLPTDEDSNNDEMNAYFDEAIQHQEKSQSLLSQVEDETSILTAHEFLGALSTVEEPQNSMSPIQTGEYFDEAVHFLDKFQQPTLPVEDETSARPSIAPSDMIEHYLSLACSSSSRFRLPHEYSPLQELSEETPEKPQVLLSPLLCGEPLTPRLIHGLLYQLAPGPVHIIELPLQDSDTHDLDTLNFVIIVCHPDIPLLVLGVASRQEITILGPETVQCTFVENFRALHPDWTYNYRNVRTAKPELLFSRNHSLSVQTWNLPCSPFT